MPQKSNLILTAAIFALALPFISGCKEETKAETATAEAPPMAEVTIYETKAEHVAVKDTLPARVAAFRVAEIRPQVSGIIQKRLFEQGSEVTENQPLFQINPAPFEADANTAAAALKRAEATLSLAKMQTQRLKPLVKDGAISIQNYDDAAAAEEQAAADVAQAKATLARKQLDVSFANVTSPISGRIDQAVVTEGALASVNSTNPLATVQQIDQVFIDVKQPASQLEELRKAASGSSKTDGDIEILFSDGKAYPVKGKLLFSGISVDPGTGDVLARVQAPNPDRTLLPGMYVMAKLPKFYKENAILVPQQSVRRNANAKSVVSIVDEKGNVKETPVEIGDVVDGFYLILSGLEAGQKIIVEGHDRVTPNTPVKPVPWKQQGSEQKTDKQTPAQPEVK